MFGSIGPQEILIVLVIALVVLGPKKLPEMARSLGKGVKEFKEGINDDDTVDVSADEEERARERARPRAAARRSAAGGRGPGARRRSRARCRTRRPPRQDARGRLLETSAVIRLLQRLARVRRLDHGEEG